MLILIADDDLYSTKMSAFLLREAGHRVLVAHDDANLSKALTTYHPDLILLDVYLPDANGFDVCRRIRDTSDVPVIFVSGEGSLESRVAGLKAGGDDYIVKPYEPTELVARVHAVSRLRYGKQPTPLHVRQGNLSLDPATHTAICHDGRVIALTPLESRILACLMQHSGRALESDQLRTKVWRHPQAISTRGIATYIHRLRSKIEANPAQPQYVLTVRNGGYMFKG